MGWKYKYVVPILNKYVWEGREVIFKREWIGETYGQRIFASESFGYVMKWLEKGMMVRGGAGVFHLFDSHCLHLRLRCEEFVQSGRLCRCSTGRFWSLHIWLNTYYATFVWDGHPLKKWITQRMGYSSKVIVWVSRRVMDCRSSVNKRYPASCDIQDRCIRFRYKAAIVASFILQESFLHSE